ncbi:MAG: hypothetical protein RXO36_03435 [Candidatus Nanopusillus acidilobi]|jgi:hypothetical protein
MVGEHKFGTQNLQEGISFIGRIISANWQQSKDFGSGSRETLVIGIQPVSYEGAIRYIYIPYSDRINSKWGKFNEMLEQSGLKFDPNTFTEIDLVGKLFEFRSFDLKFGSGENAIEVTGMLLPVRYVGDDISEEKEVPEKAPGESQPMQRPIEQTQTPVKEIPKPQTEQPKEQEQHLDEVTQEDLIFEYIKLKQKTTFKELMEKFKMDKDHLIPLIFDLSEKGKISLDGPVIRLV